MRINQNVAALNAWRHLSGSDTELSKSLERLSSGLRINRAADDAAGLAISEKMRSQVSGLRTAERNAMDAISLIQTAEGALNESHAILQRMRELAVQAATDTMTDEDRQELQNEVTQLIGELDRIAQDTEYNTMALFTGDFDGEGENSPLTFHIGANAGQSMEVTIDDMSASALGGVNDGNGDVFIDDVEIDTRADANFAIDVIDAAIGQISEQRSSLGAVQNRLEHTIASLGMAVENLQAAESRIRDADMALEMTIFTRNQILLQSGTAMLAHANMKPQSVLQLLG